MIFKVFILMITWILLNVGSVCATENDGGTDPLSDLIRLLQAEKSFSFNFKQENTNLTSGQKIEAQGRVLFENPNKFRWDYTSDPKNIIACNGITLLMILPRDKQVMMEPASRNQTLWSPLAVLTQPDYLKTNFIVKQTAITEGSAQFQLFPKTDDRQYDHFDLVIQKINSDVEFDLSIYDLAGNKNKISFSYFISGISTTVEMPAIPPDYEVTDFSGYPIKRENYLGSKQ